MSEQGLTSIAPLFIVRQLDASLAFYVEKMGFRILRQMPEQAPFFAIVVRDWVLIHLKEVGPETEPLPNPLRSEWAPWDAFVSVSDPEALAGDFRSRGLDVALSERSDGLVGFCAEDADGYTLFFGYPA